MDGASLHYLEERLHGLDDDFLLVRAFLPRPWRPGMSAIFALRAELRLLPLTVRDDSVARAKLAWWQEEWLRLASGQARHPVTRALSESLGSRTASLGSRFGSALATLSKIMESGHWGSVAEYLDTAARLGQPFADLEMALTESTDRTAMESTWQGVQAVAMLQDLPRWWRAGRPIVPLDLAARLQLRRDQLDPDSELARRLICDMSAQLSAWLDSVAGSNTPGELYLSAQRVRLDHGRRTGRLSGPRPLQRLWRTWHEARRWHRRRNT